jgi:uncharacterized protein (TIGR03437 family)
MLRSSFAFLLAASFAIPVVAQQCTVTGTPAILHTEGITERAGDVILDCTKAAPGAPLLGNLNLFLNVPITNTVTDGNVDLQLEVRSGSAWVSLSSSAHLVAPSYAAFNNISLNFDSSGSLGLRISNVRVPGNAPVNGTLSFSGTPVLAVTTPFVVIGVPQQSLLSAAVGAAVYPVGGLPDPIDFNTLIAAGIPPLTTRVTEAYAAAFEPKQSGSNTGTRILLRFSNIPPAARLFLPDAVTGSNAPAATSAGNMGLPVNGGMWAPSFAPFLLLSRVRDADPAGSGGTLAISEPSAITHFTAVSDADRFGDVTYAVYEVLNSNPAVLESAQIPMFLAIPLGNSQTGHVDQVASVAPVVDLEGTAPSTNVPRFKYTPAPMDCTSVGDCNASYFPQIQLQLDEPLDFKAAAGSDAPHKELVIRNAGGGVLEWRITPRYFSGSGWLSVLPAQGVDTLRVRVDASAKALAAGTYQAELVVEATAPAATQTIPVSFEVRVPGPPVVPAEAIVNSASRTATGIAPGSLASILGANFPPKVEVLFNTLAAQVTSIQPNEIVVVVPADLPTEVGVSVVVRAEGYQPAELATTVTQVAPAIFGALNHDWTKNPDVAAAVPGEVLQVFSTGLRLSAGPISARIHDRVIDFPKYAGPAPGQPGMEQVNFIIPADLPSMNTEVFVCGYASSAPDEKVCSRPYVVRLQRKD